MSDVSRVDRILITAKDNKLKSIIMRITGGSTTGLHEVSVRDDEYSCDCLGWVNHEKCKHVDILQMVEKDTIDTLNMLG